MKTAKLYMKRGWWKHYRTEDGHTFAVKDGKEYWYDGNVVTGEGESQYIQHDQHAELFRRIRFED